MRVVDARDVAQQLRRGRVDLDAREVHARNDHAVEHRRQCLLIHVVLIEANAHGLGVDLDQFGQRVLQTPGNGDGAALRGLQGRKLLTRDLRGRVDRRARLVDQHIAHLPMLARFLLQFG